jgi:hypothetical protein
LAAALLARDTVSRHGSRRYLMADRLRPDQDEIDFEDEELDELPGALAEDDDEDVDLEDEA